MEKPILTLTTKDFLTGISPSAFTERGGLFLAATGVSPVNDPQGTSSILNGLLVASETPARIGVSPIVDTVFAGDTSIISSMTTLFMLGNAGHLYKLPGGSNTPVDLRSGTPISNPANGLTVWGPAGGTKLLYYWMKTAIGTWDLAGTYATGWNDNVYSAGMVSSNLHPVRQFVGNIYFGNGSYVGGILDNAGTPAYDAQLLDLPAQYTVSALSDDGTYLVIAASENPAGYSMFSSNKIYFWDTNSPSWTREHEIRDPFIWAIKKMNGVNYAFGMYGVYEVTLSGVKKVLTVLSDLGAGGFAAGYGANRAVVYNESALMFATSGGIDTYGKLAPELPVAHFRPFSGGSGNISFVTASLDAGRIIFATDSNFLYSVSFGGSGVGVSAQTIYFQFPTKMSVKRIEATFGNPLATGDEFNIYTKINAVDASILFGTASYATNGAIYRKSMTPTKPLVAENLSMYFNFAAGAAKLKKIEVYGDPMST